jgi:signal transduction histidine kinase
MNEIPFDVNQRRIGGMHLPVEITGSLFTRGGQRLAMAIARDISERKQMDEELVRKEKLVTIGQLASGVAHELRNPLGVIGNSAYFLNMKLKDADKKVQKHIDILQRDVHRANRALTNLLDFSRVRPPSLEKGNVNSIITDTLADIKVPENISVEIHLNDELPEILVDPDQIRQVFLNLISNAVQAMPEGGLLEINRRERRLKWRKKPAYLSWMMTLA